MYTTQNKSTKTKQAKLPVFDSDKELQQFLERTLVATSRNRGRHFSTSFAITTGVN